MQLSWLRAHARRVDRAATIAQTATKTAGQLALRVCTHASASLRAPAASVFWTRERRKDMRRVGRV